MGASDPLVSIVNNFLFKAMKFLTIIRINQYINKERFYISSGSILIYEELVQPSLNHLFLALHVVALLLSFVCLTC